MSQGLEIPTVGKESCSKIPPITEWSSLLCRRFLGLSHNLTRKLCDKQKGRLLRRIINFLAKIYQTMKNNFKISTAIEIKL